MIAFNNQPALGYGIYTVAEVASVLNLPTAKVRYWLNKFWDARLETKSGQRYSWGEGHDKSVNFYTLIEFFVFYHLREAGFSVSKILKAHSLLSQKLETNYPFATNKIMTEGKKILFSPDEGESILHANAKMQYNIPGIISNFVKNIDFEGKSHLAERFFPAGKTSAVVIDPHHQMGQPIIWGTNILASTLFSMFKAGEGVPVIARIYKLQEQQVQDAVKFYQKAA